jgi:hypothetical protein
MEALSGFGVQAFHIHLSPPNLVHQKFTSHSPPTDTPNSSPSPARFEEFVGQAGPDGVDDLLRDGAVESLGDIARYA